MNSGAREDSTRIGSGGVVRKQAVDVAPLRRVSQAIYLITVGSRESAFKNTKTIAECLADEILNAEKVIFMPSNLSFSSIYPLLLLLPFLLVPPSFPCPLFYQFSSLFSLTFPFSLKIPLHSLPNIFFYYLKK